MEKIILKNVSDLESLAEKIVFSILKIKAETKGGVVIALSGNLGSGKTTFVQTLAKKMGVTEKVTSPTFTIMKSYSLQGEFSNLIHMDAYRIEDLSELKPLRFFELLEDKSNLLCIEWAEKIAPALPKNIMYINIEIVSDECRLVTLS